MAALPTLFFFFVLFVSFVSFVVDFLLPASVYLQFLTASVVNDYHEKSSSGAIVRSGLFVFSNGGQTLASQFRHLPFGFVKILLGPFAVGRLFSNLRANYC